MKLNINKSAIFNKLPPMLRSNPKLSLAALFCAAVILVFLFFTGSKETQEMRRTLSLEEAKPDEAGDVGVLTDSLDTKSYVSRIEKQYYDISSKLDSVSERAADLEKSTQELRSSQSEIGKIVTELDKNSADTLTQGNDLMERMLGRGKDRGFKENPSQPSRQEFNLEMAKLGEIKDKEKAGQEKEVYLPLGSFVKCTLLTGVYAPADQNNPLPVLISVDEAFYGPNNSKIPLEGAFAIGKAIGDVVSKRAIIQVVSLSSLLPDGGVFEHEEDFGYLADKDGHLGVQGELIYNTGRQLGLDFLSGFLAGGAEALSQAETSTVTGGFGQTSRNVTGNSSRYSMFSGLANSAQGMSDYYQRQLEAMIPAVKIDAGKEVTLVIQKGVRIEGLKVPNSNFSYID